jgi:hypothetical protein
VIQNGHYEILPGLLLGFHGTDHAIVERVLRGECHLESSKNSYDWLGNGVYFWEYSPQRALDFAIQASQDGRSSKGRIRNPAVIGAVIDPGCCLNLLEASALEQVKQSYVALSESTTELPENIGGIDKRKRHLDCAVIELLHQIRAESMFDDQTPLHQYQTVRGAFWEGDELYPNAGFKEKNHVQLVVRDMSCIKGYFLPVNMG